MFHSARGAAPDLLLAKHPFIQVERELQGRGFCRAVQVSFLDESHLVRYLDLEFPGHEFPAYFASLIHTRTEGSPLFMVDLLRDLRNRGVIAQEGESWVLAQSVPEIQRDLPESIRGMIEKKVERLSDDDRHVLVMASVQGQQFDSITLAKVLDRDVAEVEDRLEELGKLHRFVRALDETEFPDGTLTQRYSFIHALYQNDLYARLRPRQRVRASGAVAEALLESFGETTTAIASDLAYLFEAARQHERASDYFLLAAQHATSVYANQEAVALAERAVSEAEKLSDQARLTRILKASRLLGQLHLALSKMEDAVADFELAEKTAAELGDTEGQINALCAGAVALFNLRRTDETKAQARRVLEIARKSGSDLGAAGGEAVLGLVQMAMGEITAAEKSFNRAVPVFQEKGAPLHALEAIGFAGLLQAWYLDHEAAERSVGWTLKRSRDLGTTYHIIMNLFVRGMLRFNKGHLSEGLSDLHEGMRLAEENNERYWLSRYPNTLGWAYRELQDFDAALKWNSEGAAVASGCGFAKPEANAHLNLVNIYLELDEPQKAKEHLERAETLFEKDHWFRWRYHIRLNAELARYWLGCHDAGQALVCASESLEEARPRGARKHVAWAHKVLGDVAVMQERFDEGRSEYNAALETLRNHRCPTIEWKILLGAAEMASAFGDAALAERYRGQCRQVIHSLADSITEGNARETFLKSEAIGNALA